MPPTENIDMEDTQKFLQRDESIKDDKKMIVFTGLSKEEVLMYANDPKWVRLRWILFILFWIVWIGMLVAAVLIVVLMPKCPFRPRQTWWQKEVVYQLDVTKFKDTNNDGQGDLRGVDQNLDYFKELGVKTICLRDNIINKEEPKSILPEYETVSLKELQKTLKANDMHMIVDIPYSYLLPNTDKDENFGKETLKHWLTNVADGVRVTELPDNFVYNKLDDWTKVTAEVAEKTFEKSRSRRFIAFYPLSSSENLTKLNTIIDESFLNIEQNIFNKGKLKLITLVEKIYQNSKNNDLWPSFITGYFDRQRISSKFEDKQSSKILQGLVLLLKGTPFVLYGDELEFTTKDLEMKWDDSANCGFTQNKSKRVDCENNYKNAHSFGSGETLFRLYRNLTKLREEPSFSWGEVNMSKENKENIISFVRKAEGFSGYLVAANIGNRPSADDFKSLHNLPDAGSVAYFFSKDGVQSNEFSTNSKVSLDRILLKPGDLIVLKFDSV